MRKLFLLAIVFISGYCFGQTTTLLQQGGIGISCNAITAASSTNPGLAGGCTSLALVTSGGTLPGNYTWQTVVTGSPASVSVTFVGSLDGTTWTTIDTNTSTTGSSKTVANANSYRFLGCVPGTLSGGSSPTITCQISVTSTAGGGGGSGTVSSSSANNVAVYTAATTVGGTSLTYSQPTLTVSSATNGSAVIALSGNTSGTVTHTATATANGETITGVTPLNITLGTAGSVAGNLTLMSSATSGGSIFGTGSGTTGANAVAIWPGTITPSSNPPIIFQNSTNGNGAAGISVTSTSAYGWPSSNVNANGTYDTTLCRSAAGVVEVGTSACNTNGVVQAAAHMVVGTKFTQDTGCGTVVSSSGGATAGKFTTVGSTSCTTVITMGNSASAPNGWDCHALDLTTAADVTNPHQTASTQTTATIATGTIVANDVIQFSCIGY